MPSIDVVVPSYQYGRYLRECLMSVLTQRADNLRVLIIDNASTDNSVEEAREIALEDRRVEVVAHRVNLGATASYNEGIEWASADYFLIIDADDMLAPKAFERALAYMDQNQNVVFSHGREVQLSPGMSVADIDLHEISGTEPCWRQTTGREFIERFCRTPVNNVGANTVIRRTWAQRQVGYYRAALTYTDDIEMWLRLATLGDIADTPTLQAIRRVHPIQHSEQFRSMQSRDFLERERAVESFFAHEGKSLPGADRLLEWGRRGLGENAYWSALSHLVRGRPAEARALMAFSSARRSGARVIPPFGYLFRMERPLVRGVQVLREAMMRDRVPSRNG